MPSQDRQLLTPASYRFDEFEVVVRSETLLWRNRRVKIQKLPFRMLLVLLESPGKVVSAETLRSKLWGEDRYMDLGSGLRTAAGKLREALRDVATKPRFILTVSGQGYKFIGNVVPVFDGPPLSNLLPPAIVLSTSPLPSMGKTRLTAHSPVLLKAIAAFVLASVVISAVVLFYQYLHRPLASSQDTIVVGQFSNSTNDHALDGILLSAVRLKLEESPYLSLVTDEKLRSVLKNQNAASLPEELHACNALGSQLLLRGRISAQSPGYLITLSAWNCSRGELLTEQNAKAPSRTGILPALDFATDEMRHRLGETEDSIQKFNVPSNQATSASLAALKAFSIAEEKRTQGLEPDAIVYYKTAIDLDPAFALAYARLGTIYANLGQTVLSQQDFRKAFELRGNTTDRERLYITTHYYADVLGDVGHAIDTYQLWHNVYPRDMPPTNNLAIEYLILGEPEKAERFAKAAIQLDPSVSQPYGTLAQAYLTNGNYATLTAFCTDPKYITLDSMPFHQACFLLDFVQNDKTEMQHQLQWAHGNPAESALLEDAAKIALYHGQIGSAQQAFADARQNASKNSLSELAAAISLDEANSEADLGLKRKADKDALDALKLAPNSPLVGASAALAFANAGDIDRAQSEANKAVHESPSDTLINKALIASVHAAICLDKNQPGVAIQSLEQARPFDFSMLLDLAPAYYRGMAYLQNRQPHDAAREFQNVLDHRAIVPNSPYAVLSQLELGRALQLSGDQVNAARAYGEVERIWKDADPGFPLLRKMRDYQRELSTVSSR